MSPPSSTAPRPPFEPNSSRPRQQRRRWALSVCSVRGQVRARAYFTDRLHRRHAALQPGCFAPCVRGCCKLVASCGCAAFARAPMYVSSALPAWLALVRPARVCAVRSRGRARAWRPARHVQSSSASSSPSSSPRSLSILVNVAAMSLTLKSRATTSARSMRGSATGTACSRANDAAIHQFGHASNRHDGLGMRGADRDYDGGCAFPAPTMTWFVPGGSSANGTSPAF